MRPSRTPLLPLLVVACALLSAGLFFRSQTPIRPTSPPRHPAGESASTAPSPDPPGEPIPPPTEPPAASLPPEPPSPSSPDALPSEEELAGPLPTWGPGGKPPKGVGPGPALHAPITEVAPKPGKPTGTSDGHPATVDFPTLAGQPELWPPQVVLRAAVDFPIFRNGMEAGHVKVPAATAVLLRKVHADGNLDVEHFDTLARVPAAQTDLPARIRSASSASSRAASPAPVASPGR